MSSTPEAGLAVESWWFSKAHCCLAPSIWRKLLMQALVCEVVRARTKLGIAMAASKPMMATTIMISTSVNPHFDFDLRVFILNGVAFRCFVDMTQSVQGSPTHMEHQLRPRVLAKR